MRDFNNLKGSCLCQAVTYEVYKEPSKVSKCHCLMCQKQHGAPYGAYFSVKKSNFKYLSGEENLVSFNSSSTIERKFCGVCGSNIEWSGSPKYLQWISIALATLDTAYSPKEIENHFLEKKVCWLKGDDQL